MTESQGNFFFLGKQARGINIEDHCDLCGLSESSGHTLWGCKLAAEIWGDSRRRLPAVLNQPQEFLEIIWEVREGKPDTDWDLGPLCSHGREYLEPQKCC